MGRPKKNPTLEEQIEAAEKKLWKYYEPYKKALEELKILQDQRAGAREEKLLKLIRESKRSYDEIVEFLQSDPENDEWYTPGNGF